MVTTVSTVALYGLDGFEVVVECNCEKGIPDISVIGLPDTSVKEAIDRIRSAAENNSLPFVRNRTVFNLAPADKKKTGAYFDLPLIVALLKHSVLKDVNTDGACFIGELSLKGELRRVDGALAMCIAARRARCNKIFLPAENTAEATLVEGVEVYGITSLAQLLAHLTGQAVINPSTHVSDSGFTVRPEVDFSDIKGQEFAKRAMEVAAAGSHNILLIGPPGAGKSMLSKALAGILPDMTYSEMIETTNIHSISGTLKDSAHLMSSRPVRSPHHTVSNIGLAGGGVPPKPGEVTLAHNGVLFLDEFPEFDKKAIEILRQPLEDGKVTITRAGYKITYPSRFMLVAAMNPCPCGYYGSSRGTCKCELGQIRRYLSKISGPLLDRMDIQVEVPALSFDDITDGDPLETSAQVKARVNAARTFRHERLARLGVEDNSPDCDRKEVCSLTREAEDALKGMFDKLALSARGYTRILRLSRTVADLDASNDILSYHVYEAMRLRNLDKKYFGI